MFLERITNELRMKYGWDAYFMRNDTVITSR